MTRTKESRHMNVFTNWVSKHPNNVGLFFLRDINIPPCFPPLFTAIKLWPRVCDSGLAENHLCQIVISAKISTTSLSPADKRPPGQMKEMFQVEGRGTWILLLVLWECSLIAAEHLGGSRYTHLTKIMVTGRPETNNGRVKTILDW